MKEPPSRAPIFSIFFFLHPRPTQQTLCVTNGPCSPCSLLPQLNKYICSQAGAIKCSCEQPASPTADSSPAHTLFPLQPLTLEPSCTSAAPALWPPAPPMGAHSARLTWPQQIIPVFPHCHHWGAQKEGGAYSYLPVLHVIILNILLIPKCYSSR